MVLNDLVDQTTDRVERPGRPLPSGRISVREAWAIYIFLSVLATLTVAFLLPGAIYPALTLFSLIFIYNWSHRWLRLSPAVMGACRGCVYLLGATAGGWIFLKDLQHPNVWLMAFYLSAYVTLLSTIARGELAPLPSRLQWLALGLSFLAFLGPVWNTPPDTLGWMCAASALGVLWLSWVLLRLFRGKMPLTGGVGRLLAGISLLDGLSFAKAGIPGGILIASGCFLGTLAWHKKVKGT